MSQYEIFKKEFNRDYRIELFKRSTKMDHFKAPKPPKSEEFLVTYAFNLFIMIQFLAELSANQNLDLEQLEIIEMIKKQTQISEKKEDNINKAFSKLIFSGLDAVKYAAQLAKNTAIQSEEERERLRSE
jgi:hypothetical protein